MKQLVLAGSQEALLVVPVMSVGLLVDHPAVRIILAYFFFFFHQFFYWVLSRALLGQDIDFNMQQTFIFGLLNAVVAVPLFLLLDKMKE